MKKFFYIIIFLLCNSCTSFIKAENEQMCSRDKFVNPIFYEVMKPYSKILWQNKITETEVVETNSEGYSISYRCELLCSTETFVSLDCSKDFHARTHIWVYSLMPKEKIPDYFDKDEIVVEYRSLAPCPNNQCHKGFKPYLYNYDKSNKEMFGEEGSWGILIIKTPQTNNE